jgi:phosphoglycolate phosphatase
MMKKLVLFDIDGTLLNTSGASRRAYTIAVERIYGIADAFQDITFHGRSDPLILDDVAQKHLGRLFSELELKELYRIFEVLLEEELHNSHHPFQVMEGAYDLCSSLISAGGILLGLETGNLEKAAYSKLRRGGLDQFFRFGGFGSDHGERSRFVALAIQRASHYSGGKQFSPQEVTVIGDAVQDVRAAKANGCRIIAVTTGAHSREDLDAEGADLVVNSLRDQEVVFQLVSTE